MSLLFKKESPKCKILKNVEAGIVASHVNTVFSPSCSNSGSVSLLVHLGKQPKMAAWTCAGDWDAVSSSRSGRAVAGS